ncbi:MAG: TonB-dependent receptor, partial [Polyangiaceae bacterium]|nr:TonB-dependent receptor [Polyangiaceae bacterium]
PGGEAPGGEAPGQKPPPTPGQKPPPAPGQKPPDKLAGPETDKIVGQARTEDVYQETVVTASRGAQSPLDSPSSTTIITRQDIRLSGITRIPELLRRVAGMDVMQTTGGDENVSMRGFNSRLSNKLLVLVNGRTVKNDILGSTFWEMLTIDVDQIERIEVVRGPGSALYGADAFTGIVNIITIAPGVGKSGFRAGYGDHAQAYGSIWATAREEDTAYRVSAGFTRYPRWTREVSDDRIDVTVSDQDQDLGAQNIRLDARATQRLGQDKELYVGGGYSRDEIEFYGIGPFNDYILQADSEDATVGFTSEFINARAYYTHLGVYAQSNAAYIGHTVYPVTAEQHLLNAEVEFVKTLRAPESVEHDFHIGLGYRLKDITWGYLVDEPPIEHHGAVFLQDAMKLGPHFTFVASGRLDYVPYLKELIPSPRGSLIFKPTERQAIRVSGSTAFRSPTFLESYLDLPIQLSLPGAELVSASKRPDDPDFVVEPEQIVNAEASYLNQQSDYFEFELTAYYNRVTDFIVLAEPRLTTLSNRAGGIGGLNQETGRYTVAFGGWKNQCDTYHAVGGELGGRMYPVEGLDVFANYALNLSKQSLPDGCNVPEDERTSRHKVNAGVQVRTPVGIDGEVTFHYQSEQTWTEQVATATGIEVLSYPLPAYTLLNARIGYRFLQDHAEVSATVFNALAGITSDEPPQMHPFGSRVGRRFMGFFSYSL